MIDCRRFPRVVDLSCRAGIRLGSRRAVGRSHPRAPRLQGSARRGGGAGRVAGLTEMTVELSLKLASALGRIAGDQGLAAIDLADVWFVD